MSVDICLIYNLTKEDGTCDIVYYNTYVIFERGRSSKCPIQFINVCASMNDRTVLLDVVVICHRFDSCRRLSNYKKHRAHLVNAVISPSVVASFIRVTYVLEQGINWPGDQFCLFRSTLDSIL